jgi:hypothetical protein
MHGVFAAVGFTVTSIAITWVTTKINASKGGTQ